MECSLELLEEKFRQVEQENERRALCEPELSRAELVDPITEPRKHVKKPAVLVSRFGEQGVHGDDSVPSPLSAAASKSTFYHALANPTSVEYLMSENSEEGTHTAEQHEILIERIAGRQTLPLTVGALLPRRLARVQSHTDYTSTNKGMVIGISVETTMEPSSHPANVQTSTAYATRPPRSRAATVGVVTSQYHGGLMERAKDFARRLRQKGRGEHP